MRFRTRGKSPELADEERARLERRFRLVLGRHCSTLVEAEIGVSESGERCSIRARLHDGGSLEVEERAESIEQASEQAIWKFGHRLQRALASRDYRA